MTMRTRKYVGLVVLVALAVVLDWIGEKWSDVQFYAAGAGLLVVFIPTVLFWTEMAPDGAFHRRPPG